MEALGGGISIRGFLRYCIDVKTVSRFRQAVSCKRCPASLAGPGRKTAAGANSESREDFWPRPASAPTVAAPPKELKTPDSAWQPAPGGTKPLARNPHLRQRLPVRNDA